MTKVEFINGILKGFGRRPTRYLFRWNPSLRAPLHFDLLEVMRCGSDGEVVTYQSAQSSLGTHASHTIKSPGRFSLWDLLMVQMRIIR
jgi:hypothetical protein